MTHKTPGKRSTGLDILFKTMYKILKYHKEDDVRAVERKGSNNILCLHEAKKKIKGSKGLIIRRWDGQIRLQPFLRLWPCRLSESACAFCNSNSHISN